MCMLRKVLYELKQELQAWYGKISQFLTMSGYVVASVDSSLFIKKDKIEIIIILMYVYDLIIIRNDEREIYKAKENLSISFQMKELGELKHFIGLEVNYIKEGLFMC